MNSQYPQTLIRYLIMTTLIINKREFNSRLLLGTGKFASPQLMKESIEASETEIITTAIRRVDLNNKQDPFISIIDP